QLSSLSLSLFLSFSISLCLRRSTCMKKKKTRKKKKKRNAQNDVVWAFGGLGGAKFGEKIIFLYKIFGTNKM
ncbi:hypothetical protein, partial [Klebsiella pneumoniae]|uniref:hypothetical protein n=1 Tax=Klebsiella pneumoniae TaxID=573 RepID=UPI0027305894